MQAYNFDFDQFCCKWAQPTVSSLDMEMVVHNMLNKWHAIHAEVMTLHRWS